MWGNFNTFFLTISLHYFLTWTLEIGRFPHMEMWAKCEENCEENFSTISAHGFLTLRLEKILTFVRKSVRKTFHFPHISSQFQHIDASLESTVRKMAILDTMKCEKMVKPRPIKIWHERLWLAPSYSHECKWTKWKEEKKSDSGSWPINNNKSVMWKGLWKNAIHSQNCTSNTHNLSSCTIFS